MGKQKVMSVTLAAVITNLIILNLNTPVGCQVCAVSQDCTAEILVLNCHKLSAILEMVGSSLLVRLQG